VVYALADAEREGRAAARILETELMVVFCVAFVRWSDRKAMPAAMSSRG
jgi:hypothetical protein